MKNQIDLYDMIKEEENEEQEYKTKPFNALVVFKSGKSDTYIGTKSHFDHRKKFWEEIDYVTEVTCDEMINLLLNNLGMNKYNKSINQSMKDKTERLAANRYLKSGF